MKKNINKLEDKSKIKICYNNFDKTIKLKIII